MPGRQALEAQASRQISPPILLHHSLLHPIFYWRISLFLYPRFSELHCLDHQTWSSVHLSMVVK